MTTKKPEPEKLRLKMAGLCARSEQCTFDIALKLRRHGLTIAQTNEILAFLRDGRFLDDRRYAAAFAADKVRFSAWGRLKIRMGLRAKRIPDSIIAEAIEKIDEEDYANALMRAARAKAASLTLTDPADKRKLYLHLASRGFESSLIADAVRRLCRSSIENHQEDD